MQSHVFALSTRMLTVAGLCLVALCALLFMLGVEIGRLAATPSSAPVVRMQPLTLQAPPVVPEGATANPAGPAAPNAMLPAPASSTSRP